MNAAEREARRRTYERVASSVGEGTFDLIWAACSEFARADERERTVTEIVERIRREASETFDMQLDMEFRDLAKLIAREFGSAKEGQ
jgi:hypothetical protein